MTILLTRSEVAALLSIDECISAVEQAFRLRGLGDAAAAGIAGAPVPGGGFHVKTAVLGGRFAAKVNGNFPGNPARGLPAIQGAIVLCDTADGRPLAILDSIEITILRTGAATAVAAKHLARADSGVVTVFGCGNQGRIQLRALSRVRPLVRAYAWDVDPARSQAYAAELSTELGIPVLATRDPADAASRSDICVTCTPSRAPILRPGMVAAGTFVAAVGADSEEKWELAPSLLGSSKVVTDVTEQCATIGDLHHALAAGALTRAGVYAELGEIVAGRKPGRTREDETIVFDSTGMALQDVAAAALVYERARAAGRGVAVELCA